MTLGKHSRGTLGSMPISVWLVGGSGVLLAAFGLALTVWSKGLVKDTLRYGSTEVGARHQVETRNRLGRLLRVVQEGELPPECKATWRFEAGVLVQRTPEDAPAPPVAFADVTQSERPQGVSIQGVELRAASWVPATTPPGDSTSGLLVEWNLDRIEAGLRERLAAESGRYVATLQTAPERQAALDSPPPLAVLALPQPLSTWKVSVGLRDPQAEREAVRIQTFALAALVVWLLGLLAFGLWRGAQRERRERERRVQREQLLVRTTHELQTPLALLRAACESIENGAVEGADRHRALGIVVREEARLTAAIRRLLRHLRVENAPLELASVGATVEAVAADERSALEAHGIALELNVEASAHAVAASEAFVSDLVRELCANARKHARGARRVALRASARGTTAQIHYADDGPGFAPLGGVARGLGMLLLHDGLTALGGTLTRGAAPDGGAQLEVSLPCQRTSTPS